MDLQMLADANNPNTHAHKDKEGKKTKKAWVSKKAPSANFQVIKISSDCSRNKLKPEG